MVAPAPIRRLGRLSSGIVAISLIALGAEQASAGKEPAAGVGSPSQGIALADGHPTESPANIG